MLASLTPTLPGLAHAQAEPGLALEERIWAGECEESARPSGPLAADDCYAPRELHPEESYAYEVGPFPVMDLSPWFPEEHAYHKARRKVEGRDCQGALRELEPALEACGESCAGDNALRLLAGQAALCAGQPKQALELAQRLTQRGYPGMEPEVRSLLRDAQARLGLRQAPELEPSLIYGASTYLEDQFALARQEAREGKLGEARLRLQALQALARDQWQVRRASALEGRLLEEAGMLEDAGQLYYRVWSRDPRSRLGQQMASRLEDLERRGVARYTLDPGERLDALLPQLARAKKRQRRDLVHGFAARHKLSASDRQALEELALGVYLEREREREKALKALERAARQVRDPAILARVDFARGTALRRLDRDAEAVEVYQALALRSPRDPISAEALYQAGRLQVYLGRYEAAREDLARLVLLYPDAPVVPDALWQAAWSDWLKGDAAASLRLLEHLERFHGQARDDSGLPYQVKARYWQARARGAMGQISHSLADLRFVTERFPLTYYAAMAHAWMDHLAGDQMVAAPFQPQLAGPLQIAELRDPAACQVPAHPRARRALELWKLGQHGQAKEALLSQLQYQRAPRGVVEVLATFYLEEGNLGRSHWIADRYGHFSVAPYAGNARLWGLAYPAPENLTAHIDEVSQEVGLSRSLPLAIIRHESAFQPSARSRVGAVGLMQLMPGTAQVIQSSWYGGKGPSRKALHQPRTNIRLGTTMLRMLDHYYKGNLPLMVAAYNAGPGVANRWWRDNKQRDTDTLVEQITYPLTMAYTKKVIGSYYAYRVLYGEGSPPPISLQPPQELGEWGRPPESQPVGLR